MEMSPSQLAEIFIQKRYRRIGISAMISDQETLSSNARPVHSKLIQDVVTFWRWLPLSDVGKTLPPNMRSDVWDHVESYAIRMLLASRLKIILSTNLKLIISFLVLHIVLLSFFSR